VADFHGVLKVWNGESGALLMTLPEFRGRVGVLAGYAVESGHRLVVGGFGGVVQVGM
jgi:hypothetical protein